MKSNYFLWLTLTCIFFGCQLGNSSKKEDPPISAEIISASLNMHGDIFGKYNTSFNIKLRNISNDSIIVFGCGFQNIYVINQLDKSIIDSLNLPPYPLILGPFEIDTVVYGFSSSKKVEKNLMDRIVLEYKYKQSSCLTINNGKHLKKLNKLTIK